MPLSAQSRRHIKPRPLEWPIRSFRANFPFLNSIADQLDCRAADLAVAHSSILPIPDISLIPEDCCPGGTCRSDRFGTNLFQYISTSSSHCANLFPTITGRGLYSTLTSLTACPFSSESTQHSCNLHHRPFQYAGHHGYRGQNPASRRKPILRRRHGCATLRNGVSYA
jgi:hypothetical protein